MSSFSSLCIITTFLSLSVYETMGDWTWEYPKNQYETQGKFYGTAPACGATSNSCSGDYKFPWYPVTSGDGHYCSSGRKYYCNKWQSPYSSVRWAGTATACAASCDDCTDGEVCVAKSNSGDGQNCVSGDKFMCVRYHSNRRLMNKDQEINNDGLIDYESELVPNGIETGFYLYFGNKFNNNLLLNDQELLNEFILAVGNTLKELIPDGDVDYNDGKISGSGYINNVEQCGNEYKPIFKDAKLVPFINIKYDSHTIDTLAVKAYLTDKSNTKIINKAIELELLKENSVFGDLDYDVQVLFVDANCY